MAITKLSDITQLPVHVSDYILQEALETNAFYQSGIIRTDVGAELQAMLNAGGKEVVFPFFNDLTGSGQILDEADNLTIGKVTTGSGKAPVFERGEVWGSTDLVADFLGNDPMKLIADRVAAFWSRKYAANLLAVCAGAVGAVTANVLDISGLSGAAAVIDADTFIDAKSLLGDRSDKLTAIAMHSKTKAALEKQNLITYITPTEGLKETIAYYGDKRVIIDDTMTVSSGVYTSYLFAAGTILFGEGGVKVPEEVERQALVSGGQEYLVSRKRWIMTPTGISWTGTPTKLTPSDAEVATTGNWTLKYDQKNIGIVKFIHKIA